MLRYVPGGALGLVLYLALLAFLTGCAAPLETVRVDFEDGSSAVCTFPYEGADYCHTPAGACFGYECPEVN